jgi:hypothetical protein
MSFMAGVLQSPNISLNGVLKVNCGNRWQLNIHVKTSFAFRFCRTIFGITLIGNSQLVSPMRRTAYLNPTVPVGLLTSKYFATA